VVSAGVSSTSFGFSAEVEVEVDPGFILANMFVLALAGLEADWPNENPEEGAGVDVDVDVEPKENPEEAG
jgi:hypothetical protein